MEAETGTDLAQAVAREFAALHARGELAEQRPGQLRMANAIAEAIDAGGHLVVHAGTGVGKTLAYLVPLVLSGQKAVVSTATKSLQEQVAARDLPMLRDALGREVTWTVVKGRGSYLCQQKVAEAQEGTVRGSARRLIEWSLTTETGDRDELGTAVPDSVWQKLSVSGDQCPGRDACPRGADCFAELARTRAQTTGLVVTNHHVYAASLIASRQMLPEHDVVVFDEAHQLDEAVRQITSTRVDPTRIGRIMGALGGGPFSRLCDLLAPCAGRYLRVAPEGLDVALEAARMLVSQAASEQRALAATGDTRARRRAHSFALIAENLALSTDRDGRLRWVEGSAKEPVLRSCAADAGAHQALADGGPPTAILTSATIGPDALGDLGLRPGTARVERVPSPFEYEQRAVLYCAAHLPDPRLPEWTAAMHEELTALIKAAGGRTLALFTSWSALHGAIEHIAPQIDGTVLVQGDSGRRELLQRFREDVSSCLFATIGLAQGTDIPGDALRLVTIDRLPFPPVHDPYFQARRAAAGPAAFAEIDLRHAQTVLAQVAGRLIRTQTDCGVFAVLDPRLASAPYRWPLVCSVPAMRRSRDIEVVRDFLRDCDSPVYASSAAARNT